MHFPSKAFWQAYFFVLKKLGLLFGRPYWFNGRKICLGMTLTSFIDIYIYMHIHIKSVLVSSLVVCFLICSIKVNSVCCWKLCFCSLKYLHSKIESCNLASFLWLMRRMLKGVSYFPTSVKLAYTTLEQIN